MNSVRFWFSVLYLVQKLASCIACVVSARCSKSCSHKFRIASIIATHCGTIRTVTWRTLILLEVIHQCIISWCCHLLSVRGLTVCVVCKRMINHYHRGDGSGSTSESFACRLSKHQILCLNVHKYSCKISDTHVVKGCNYSKGKMNAVAAMIVPEQQASLRSKNPA